ncbi:MAG: hypothetical protein JWP25_4721 [Bradyrhizobium sp.]|nr:hypothetical protein [Bradyrhizobium sp.]
MGMTLQWHRRQAITLASQLPDDPADALLVVQALKELVENYLAEDLSKVASILPFEIKTG